MITKQDVQEAIAECEGVRNPSSSTCIKLAAYYTILKHMQQSEEEIIPTYSFSPSPDPPENPPNQIDFHSESDFAKAIQGKEMDEVWKLIEELVLTIQIVNPRLYEGFMRKLK